MLIEVVEQYFEHREDALIEPCPSKQSMRSKIGQGEAREEVAHAIENITLEEQLTPRALNIEGLEAMEEMLQPKEKTTIFHSLKNVLLEAYEKTTKAFEEAKKWYNSVKKSYCDEDYKKPYVETKEEAVDYMTQEDAEELFQDIKWAKEGVGSYKILGPKTWLQLQLWKIETPGGEIAGFMAYEQAR